MKILTGLDTSLTSVGVGLEQATISVPRTTGRAMRAIFVIDGPLVWNGRDSSNPLVARAIVKLHGMATELDSNNLVGDSLWDFGPILATRLADLIQSLQRSHHLLGRD